MKYCNEKNIACSIFPENKGAALRRWEVISNADPDEICILLGMDDELLPNALDVIVRQYEAGKWMTYGNWIDQHGQGLPNDFQYDFLPEIHRERSYRKQSYRSTAPNTFYAYLFQQIPVTDFQIDGKWIDSTTESEVMFSCMEMCGQERIGIIRDKIYLYRKNLPNGTLRRLGTEYKYRILSTIQGREAKARISVLPFLCGPNGGDIPEFNALDSGNRNNSMDTEVTQERWEGAHAALAERRKGQSNIPTTAKSPASDYASHLKKCFVGSSVLDVGCGGQTIKKCLSPSVLYTGIDPFPVVDETIPIRIEDCDPENINADTVCCFAALDNVQNLSKSLCAIGRCAKKNVVFLTGIGIDPDKYHTHKIEMHILDAAFNGWKKTLCEEIQPKVWLIEYTRV